ncbi:MAG: CBS domain-containing protein [Myxococcota bacterium]|nr:CBS domain-containing protein [Myxococcota bacterium]
MKKRLVSELMTPSVACLTPKTTVREAARQLAERRVGGAPVVDSGGAILGVVTQNDLARFAAQRVSVSESGEFFTTDDDYADLEGLPSDTLSTPVEQVMTSPVHTVNPDTSAAVAANIMRERRIHRLVVTERGRLVGMITSLDLMRVVEEAI